MSRGKIMAVGVLCVPALLVAVFFAYVSVANDPGCGSQAPGLCFGVGLLSMLALPVAFITTPLAAGLILFDLFQRFRGGSD